MTWGTDGPRSDRERLLEILEREVGEGVTLGAARIGPRFRLTRFRMEIAYTNRDFVGVTKWVSSLRDDQIMGLVYTARAWKDLETARLSSIAAFLEAEKHRGSRHGEFQ